VVIEALREHIARNHLRPGDKLPGEQALAQDLGISRNAVREGLKALQMAGVLQRRPRLGTTLCTLDLSAAAQAVALPVAPSQEELQELFEARHYLELALLPLIAANARETDFRMEAAIVRQRRDLQNGGDGVEDDTAFHRALLQAAGNRHLAQLAEIVRRYFGIAREALRTEPDLRDARLASLEEHVAIVQALRRGDASAAQQVMDIHLSRAHPGTDNRGARV
jgi:DNA-binding FadR family transcriptional regulator